MNSFFRGSFTSDFRTVGREILGRRFLLLPLVLILLFLSGEVVPVSAAGRDALIVSLFGKVEARTSPDEEWVRASRKMRLRSGYALRTAKGAWCIIELSPGNLVRVMEKTEVDLEEVRNTTESVRGQFLFKNKATGAYHLHLEEGSVLPALSRLSGRDFTVSTPVAVAGVRGTVFEADVVRNEAGASGGEPTYDVNFSVFEGSVAVQDLSAPTIAPTIVRAGYHIQMRGARPPAAGNAAKAARKKAVRSLRKYIRSEMGKRKRGGDLAAPAKFANSYATKKKERRKEVAKGPVAARPGSGKPASGLAHRGNRPGNVARPQKGGEAAGAHPVSGGSGYGMRPQAGARAPSANAGRLHPVPIPKSVMVQTAKSPNAFPAPVQKFVADRMRHGNLATSPTRTRFLRNRNIPRPRLPLRRLPNFRPPPPPPSSELTDTTNTLTR